MRKVVLSMALLAASGAYVGYENYFASTAAAAVPTGGSADGRSAASATAASQAAAAGAAATPCSTGAVSQADPAAATQSQPAQGIDSGRLVPTISAAVTLPVQPDTVIGTVGMPVVPLPRLRPAEPPIAEGTSAAAQAAVRYRDGTFKGTDANAYYGRVQVEAVIKGGQIAAINILDYPGDRRTSRYINAQALPMLEQEVIQAQSASIDAVSGATLTSEAFVQSLDAALAAATGGSGSA